MKKHLCLFLALVLCLSLCACKGEKSADDPAGVDGAEGNIQTDSNTTETTVVNNGEWDKLLCSGDNYHLVLKEIDTYNEYKIMLGVIDSSGQWVRELTDTGKFVENVRFRAGSGGSKDMLDSSCYAYLGEGVFMMSPGASVFTENDEIRVGPWENIISSSPTGRKKVAIWECVIWNVADNIQAKFDASKLSVFNDGYLLFCEEDEYGGGMLCSLNTKGESVELPCKYLPNKPKHNFPIYSEGLFYACADNKKSTPAFFDIEGNTVIDLSEYEMARIMYSSILDINAPYFVDGQATIMFANKGKTVYRAIIDKSGNIIGEPQVDELATSTLI